MPQMIGWASYTPRHRVPSSSPFMYISQGYGGGNVTECFSTWLIANLTQLISQTTDCSISPKINDSKRLDVSYKWDSCIFRSRYPWGPPNHIFSISRRLLRGVEQTTGGNNYCNDRSADSCQAPYTTHLTYVTAGNIFCSNIPYVSCDIKHAEGRNFPHAVT
jgi:hypothetical protein